jgi:Mrp family chromosome partitioning ATPase
MHRTSGPRKKAGDFMLFERKSSRNQRFKRPLWTVLPQSGGGAEGATATNVVEIVPSSAPKRTSENYGDAESALRFAKIIATVNEQSAGVIGITGSRCGIGVSLACRELAGGLSRFGTRTLLVELSSAKVLNVASEDAIAAPSLLPLCVEASPTLFVVDTHASRSLVASPRGLAEAVAEARNAGFTVILDLPPVLQKSGSPDPKIAAGGLLCDLVYLVCLSGETDQKELQACIETSRIVGMKMGGIILNDRCLPGSRLLGS